MGRINTKIDPILVLDNIVLLTDDSTGAPSGDTIAAVTDVATAADAIATLSVKVNEIVDALKAKGYMQL